MSIHINNSEYVDIGDNIFLHIRDWGQGKTIVFVPGWPLGHEMFEYQFTQLPRHGYRCVGISMRGFGKSSKPWGEYTYDVFADDLLAVLHSLALNNVTLVGFSMGGAIALRYMARHKGDRIDNLVLCGAAAPCFTTRPGFPFGIEPEIIDRLIELCLSDRAKLNADFGKIFFRDSTVISPQLLDWFQSLGMEASPHATAACLETLRDSDLREEIQNVHVPTAIFHGVHDQVCPFELAEAMSAPAELLSDVAASAAAGIRGAKLIRFENSGHALFYEEREKFNAELIKFIDKKSSKEKIFFPL